MLTRKQREQMAWELSCYYETAGISKKATIKELANLSDYELTSTYKVHLGRALPEALYTDEQRDKVINELLVFYVNHGQDRQEMIDIMEETPDDELEKAYLDVKKIHRKKVITRVSIIAGIAVIIVAITIITHGGVFYWIYDTANLAVKAFVFSAIFLGVVFLIGSIKPFIKGEKVSLTKKDWLEALLLTSLFAGFIVLSMIFSGSY